MRIADLEKPTYLVTKEMFSFDDIPVHWAFLILTMLESYVDLTTVAALGPDKVLESGKTMNEHMAAGRAIMESAVESGLTEEQMQHSALKAYWAVTITNAVRGWNVMIAEED